MARLVTSGFEIYVSASPAAGDTVALQEAGAPDGYLLVSGAPTAIRATTGQRSGAGCLRVNVTAAGQSARCVFSFTEVNDRGYWWRCHLKIAALPGSTINIMALGNGLAQLNASGQVLHSYATSLTSASINDGAYHRIEMYAKPSATQASRAWELRVDGTTVSSGTGQSIEALQTFCDVGQRTAGVLCDLYFDDVALNDDQGSSQNSWPGDGYVICLLPTADNTRGSWTGGAGGTTSLFDALNNTPPTGATAPGTNASQISANAVATTGKFDTQTYVAAGSGASDTAVGCTLVASTGEQVTTGTKSGSASTDTAVNNSPTATTGALNYGLDLGTEAAWPTFWRWWASPFTAYASQPTLSSGARLNIATTTTARVADCCFLGLIVEMQPTATAAAVIPDVGMALTVT